VWTRSYYLEDQHWHLQRPENLIICYISFLRIERKIGHAPWTVRLSFSRSSTSCLFYSVHFPILSILLFFFFMLWDFNHFNMLPLPFSLTSSSFRFSFLPPGSNFLKWIFHKDVEQIGGNNVTWFMIRFYIAYIWPSFLMGEHDFDLSTVYISSDCMKLTNELFNILGLGVHMKIILKWTLKT
jgi:hypothetical protein